MNNFNSFNGLNTSNGPYIMDSCEDTAAVDRYYPPMGTTAFLFVWKEMKMYIKSTNNYGVPGQRMEFKLEQVVQQPMNQSNDNDRLSKLEKNMNKLEQSMGSILEILNRNERPMNNKQKGGNRNESTSG